MLKLGIITYRLGLRAESLFMYRADYFINGFKVSLTDLKNDGYDVVIIKHFKKLFQELKPYLFIPGSSVSTSFSISNSSDIFTIKLYYKKGSYIELC